MTNFDFKRAKQEIAQINAIVETCPEPLREKCFELLFHSVFGTGQGEQNAREAAASTPPAADKTPDEDRTADHQRQGRKLPSNVLSFAHRHSVTPEEIGKLFLLDHDPLLPVYKIPTDVIAKAQLSKVMMILLENGLLSNQLSVPYPELRDSVKEDGLTGPNFNKVLKRNHTLFRGAISKDSIDEEGTVELTGAGMEKLAATIKELNQP